jgi:integrase/recombinase XerD
MSKGTNEHSISGPRRQSTPSRRLSETNARLVELFEAEVSLRCADRTITEYLSHVRAFVGWAQERRLGLTCLVREDLVRYQAELFGRRRSDGRAYSSGFHANRYTALKCFFAFLIRRGISSFDPLAGLQRPRQESRLPRSILTPAEARRVLEAPCDGTPVAIRDRAILETLYATGIRASELIGLTPADVDTSERTLHVIQGKGGKDRNVPLTRPAADAIEAYIQMGRPLLLASSRPGSGVFPEKASRRLFVSPRGGVLYRATLDAAVRRWARVAGVDKRVTAHTFRHSIATHLLQRGADIRHIQVFLGHESLTTTERYTRVEISDLKAVVRRAHPRGR